MKGLFASQLRNSVGLCGSVCMSTKLLQILYLCLLCSIVRFWNRIVLRVYVKSCSDSKKPVVNMENFTFAPKGKKNLYIYIGKEMEVKGGKSLSRVARPQTAKLTIDDDGREL